MPPARIVGAQTAPSWRTLRITHSVFAADGLVRVLLPDYDLDNVIECRLLQHNQNDTYLVRSDRGQFILKIYQARGMYTPRGLSQIQYEVDLLLYLQRRGAAVVAPVVRRDGRYLGLVDAPEGTRTVVMVTYAPGEPVEPAAWDHGFSHRLGATLGTMHAAAVGFASEQPRFHLDRTYLLTRPLRLARPLFAHRPDDWAYLQALARRLAGRLAALAAGGLSRGICHGDIVGKTNVHVTPAGGMTLFDFECCGPGWRAYDIAVFRWALVQLTVVPCQGWGFGLVVPIGKMSARLPRPEPGLAARRVGVARAWPGTRR